MTTITANHLAELERSAIDSTAASAAGIASVTAKRIGEDCFGPGQTAAADGYLIPYPDSDYRRYRITPAPAGGPKYVSPAGLAWDVYDATAVLPDADEPGKPLIITEGEKKALGATASGFPALGIGGVTQWQDPAQAGKGLTVDTPIHPRIARRVEGRVVAVIGDSDLKDNAQARSALYKLAQAIATQARVRGVCFFLVTAADDGSKQGLDDWLYNAGAGPLTEALESKAKAGEFVHPGWVTKVPYSRCDHGNLHYMVPRIVPGDPVPPKVCKEIDGGEEGVTLKGTDAAHALIRRLILHPVNRGGAFSTAGGEAPRVSYEVEAATAYQRSSRVLLDPDKVRDLRNLREYGIFGGVAETMSLWQAQVHAHSIPETIAVDDHGWLNVDGRAYYVYGSGSVIPEAGAPVTVVESSRAAVDTDSRVIDRAGDAETLYRAYRGLLSTQPLFALLAGLAASGPALRVVPEAESTIIHLYGASRSGKTTAARAIGALRGSGARVGRPGAVIQSWRSTENALENTLYAANDAFAVLDEIHQAPREALRNVGYMAEQGSGKNRMKRDGSARENRNWSSQVISTGEESFFSYVSGHVPEGLHTRVINVNLSQFRILNIADAGGPGWWSDTLSADFDALDPQAIVARLGELVSQHYGHAWPELVRVMMEEPGRVDATYAEEMQRVQAGVDAYRGGIIGRVKHGAAMLTGLRLLSRIVGLEDGADADHITVARGFFLQHLIFEGFETESSEEMEITEAVLEHIYANEKLFKKDDESLLVAHNHYGWRDDSGTAYVYASVWKRFCADAGVDPGRARKELEAEGWKFSQPRRAPKGHHKSRVKVHIAPRVFEDRTIGGGDDVDIV